jgi:hypothetical protein
MLSVLRLKIPRGSLSYLMRDEPWMTEYNTIPRLIVMVDFRVSNYNFGYSAGKNTVEYIYTAYLREFGFQPHRWDPFWF